MNKDMVQLNRAAILKLLRKEGPLSRGEIAKRLKLSFPTVSANVTGLLSAGIVREVGQGKSCRGRRPVLIEYSSDAGFVVGVDVGGKYMRAALSNIGGEIIGKIEIPSLTYQGANKVFARVLHSVEQLVSDAGIDSSRLLAIGVGLPGIIRKSGGVIRSPFFASESAALLSSSLEERFGSPVIVENDVNMAVVGEKWKGAAKGYRNIVFINLGLGFSCGIIINGELYQGADGAAGESGFMVLGKEFLQDSFRERGSLECKIAGEGIVTAMMQRLEQSGIDPNSVLPPERDAETVFALAAGGNAVAHEVIGELITYFAMALVNIVSILNPEIVVIGGALGLAVAGYIDEIIAILARHLPYVPKVVPSELGTIAGVLGSVAVALRTGRDDLAV